MTERGRESLRRLTGDEDQVRSPGVEGQPRADSCSGSAPALLGGHMPRTPSGTPRASRRRASLSHGSRDAAPPASHTLRWSARVTRESDALDLESRVFTRTPRAIALSLRRSAERSTRRKSDAFRSAMSMLTFYVN